MKAFEVNETTTADDFVKFAQKVINAAQSDDTTGPSKQDIIKAIAAGNTKGVIKERIQKAMANADEQTAYFGVLAAIDNAAKRMTKMDKEKNPNLSQSQEMIVYKENKTQITNAVNIYLVKHYTKGKLTLPKTTKEIVNFYYQSKASK